MLRYSLVGYKKINGVTHTYVFYTAMNRAKCHNFVNALNEINDNPTIRFSVGQREF